MTILAPLSFSPSMIQSALNAWSAIRPSKSTSWCRDGYTRMANPEHLRQDPLSLPQTQCSGQQAALGHDLRALIDDLLQILRAVLTGSDCGGRAACIVLL